MKINDALATGNKAVRLVGFGDSITGVYYHTGGRRAWPEMLGLALQRLCPQAKIEVTNAGLSGGNTASGLARMDKDVLAHQPDLVVVMFGMNDVVANAPEAYEANLRTIVERSRGVGAEVVLCTPNAIYDLDPGRPMSRLREYAGIVRKVGEELVVPVCDCFAAYEAVQTRSPRDFATIMSDAIHPNMRGHKLFAEEIAHTITGRRVSLEDVGPLSGLPHVKQELDAGQPLRVLAMPPYDALIEPALQALYPQAQMAVTRWEVAGQSLAQIEKAAQAQGWMGLRDHPDRPKPDLVIFAVPAEAGAPDDDRFYRSTTWILNWSLSFGKSEWDAFAVTPSVAKPDLTDAERGAEEQALEVITGQDLPYLTRLPGQTERVETLLQAWLRRQLVR
jgi:lysophospholipase L1-like esterase